MTLNLTNRRALEQCRKIGAYGQWYRIKNAAVPEVLLFDDIGFFGIQAEQFVREFSALEADRIVLRINSPGGAVFDGIAIFNAVQRHNARIEVHVDGLAASIASVIAMAGDEIIMSDGSMMMIHNPMSIVIGESDDMRKEADLLDQVKGQLVNIYATKTGMERTRVAQMMDDETWMTDSEAVELGFADKQTDDEAEIMDFDLSRFNNVPDDLEAREKNDGLNIRAIERALTREAGLSRNEALDLMHGSSVDDLVAMREAGTEKVDWSAFAQRWRNAT